MYSAEEYVEMLIIFGECGRNAREAARVYSERFPGGQRPDHKTVLRLIARTQETGAVAPNREEIGGGHRFVRTVGNEEAILNAVEDDGSRSVRDIAREMNISGRSVHRVLQQYKFHPFHYTRVHHLQPEDYAPRRNFCVWLLNQSEEDPNFISRVLFSDESTFGRQGCFNTRNLHVWSEENPNATFPRAFQNRFSINLWAGLLGDSVVGPFEFPERLTGETYANFLRVELPALLDAMPLIFRQNGWFQHDGAPPHFSRQAQNVLNRSYPDRWMGRGGPRLWPARSPDLTPLDFFLWGHVKNFIYKRPIDTELDLRNRIRGAFATITPEMIRNAQASMLRRARLCLQANGGHFEHLL